MCFIEDDRSKSGWAWKDWLDWQMAVAVAICSGMIVLGWAS